MCVYIYVCIYIYVYMYIYVYVVYIMFSWSTVPLWPKCSGHVHQRVAQESRDEALSIEGLEPGEAVASIGQVELPKCLVYEEKSYQNGWFGGTPISGNPQKWFKMDDLGVLPFQPFQETPIIIDDNGWF